MILLGALAVCGFGWALLLHRDRERAIAQAAELTEELCEVKARRDAVRAALAQCVAERVRLAAARRPPPTPSPHAKRVSPGMERILSRTHRPGCPRPDKRAYDVGDEEEVRIMDANTSDGLVPYICGDETKRGCGFTHLGHLRPPSPIPLDGPRAWVHTSAVVDLLTGSGDVHAIGTALAFHEDPTLVVQVRAKRVTWPAGMTRLHNTEQTEQVATKETS